MRGLGKEIVYINTHLLLKNFSFGRMCKLSNYSEDTQECCGHVLLDLLIASWFGGVPANYREFAQRACMKSVGVLVHGNELEPNITSLLLDKV